MKKEKCRLCFGYKNSSNLGTVESLVGASMVVHDGWLLVLNFLKACYCEGEDSKRIFNKSSNSIRCAKRICTQALNDRMILDDPATRIIIDNISYDSIFRDISTPTLGISHHV
jgi:hypothetical protein